MDNPKKLPKDLVLLRELKLKIDEYYVRCNTREVARSTDIYEYVKNKEPFKSEFQSGTEFNRFLRKTHDAGVFTQLIPNSLVDTSNHEFYQWRFYPLEKSLKNKTNIEDENLATSHPSTNLRFKENKQYIASNGTTVRSKHELLIMNKLLSEETFDVYYERPLKVDTYAKYPDFTIVNKNTKTVFHWEHFGMINDSDYKEKMTSKIQWYRDKGYHFLEEGGNVIVTYFENDTKLIESVQSNIEAIKLR